MKIIELPKKVTSLLEHYEAPQRLIRHLTIVHATAFYLSEQLNNTWQQLPFNIAEILFGAATHDIGKVIVTDEIYQEGKLHEVKGFALLKQHGFSDSEARFTITHGNWKAETNMLEDLIVCLADKVWKGKRIPELEEEIVKRISTTIYVDFWEVFMQFEAILEKIVIGADDRIAWQGI